MEVSAKELRIQPGKILEQVVMGNEIIITFRGKALAKMIPIQNDMGSEADSIFGLWKDHKSTGTVEEEIRHFRKGREF